MNDEQIKIKILSRCGKKEKNKPKSTLRNARLLKKKSFHDEKIRKKKGRKDAKIIINLRSKDREK